MKIGFIGLGTMGRHMAANLQKAGHELVVDQQGGVELDLCVGHGVSHFEG